MIAATRAALVAIVAAAAAFVPISLVSVHHDFSAHAMNIRMTGYSYWDNTPPGSADICCSVIHRKAGGIGTYDDPITVAVPGSGSSMEFRAGTRFYSPDLRRYLIVEDSGASHNSLPHLDVYVDGRGRSRHDSDRCMDQITGTKTVFEDPGPHYPVTVGPLTASRGCHI